MPETDTLTPLWHVLLSDALAGDAASEMALCDWLDEQGRDSALACWRWARRTGKRPKYAIHYDDLSRWRWWLRAELSRVKDDDDLPCINRNTAFLPLLSDLGFGPHREPTALACWVWLLETWAPHAQAAGVFREEGK